MNNVVNLAEKKRATFDPFTKIKSVSKPHETYEEKQKRLKEERVKDNLRILRRYNIAKRT